MIILKTNEGVLVHLHSVVGFTPRPTNHGALQTKQIPTQKGRWKVSTGDSRGETIAPATTRRVSTGKSSVGGLRLLYPSVCWDAWSN